MRKIGERDGAAVGTRDDRGGDEVDTLFRVMPLKGHRRGKKTGRVCFYYAGCPEGSPC